MKKIKAGCPLKRRGRPAFFACLSYNPVGNVFIGDIHWNLPNLFLLRRLLQYQLVHCEHERDKQEQINRQK